MNVTGSKRSYESAFFLLMITKRLFYFLMNLWPPFLGSGISFKVVKESPLAFEVQLKLRWYNRNYVGTQYGGSLYSMADPWLMLILIDALGRDFLVWDKAATIRFLRPGKKHVRARFEILPEQIRDIRETAMSAKKCEPVFTISIFDSDGQEIAQVDKVLWVKRKRK